MRRREVIAALAAASIARPGAAAEPSRPFYRVGLLSAGAPISNESEQGSAFLHGLTQAGYMLGHNLELVRRGASGQIEQLPVLARELIAANADVLVAAGYPAAVAAKATGHPAVVIGAGDAVLAGLVETLARPGGNLTGISDVAAELSAKRLSLLRELVPGLRRVAMLWNQDDLGMTLRYRASADAAEAMGIRVQALGVRAPNDFEAAFGAMQADMPDAILMVADSLTNLNRGRVFGFALEHRVPAIYELAFYVRDGGLMSYGPSLSELFERAAALVDRILKGTKPADLPFELPTRYVLAFNLATAKAIALEIPPSLLARADEVID